MAPPLVRLGHIGENGGVETLTDDQRARWSIDGYLHIEGALTPDEVAAFSDELDRIRTLPGWEPDDNVLGHYAWLDHAVDLDNEGFMDRRDLLPYGPLFIDLIDRPETITMMTERDRTQ